MWKARSYFSGQSGSTNGDEDGYGKGKQYYEATGNDGKKRGPSKLKKQSSKREEHDSKDYNTSYTSQNHDDAKDDHRYNSNGKYRGKDYGGSGDNRYNGGGAVVGAPYNPYYSGGGGGGDGYSNYTPYSSGGYSSNNSSPPSYNLPSGYWVPQDGARSPMIIQTREVNMWGPPPGSQYDNDYYGDQRRRGGGDSGNSSGFFAPAFHAVGHFIDRRFGLQDRN